MEFKELSIEELTSGFVWSEEKRGYVCIFCGELFEEGLVYQSRGRMVTAGRAIEEHIFDEHGGVFYGLISLDKQISGLSEAQKDILQGLYQEKNNRELGAELGISAATVRTHKFNLQKMKREARILLAVLAQIEDEMLIKARKQLEGEQPEEEKEPVTSAKEFKGNNLHPFFTQFNLK
ncbi:MAG: LuxR C-terminal-related transcriptional regulator [Emergencia sp.]